MLGHSSPSTFISSHPFSRRPIPILDTSRSTVGRTAIEVNLDDTRAGEKLVDVRTLGVLGQNYYYREDGANRPYGVRIDGAIEGLLMRKTAAEMVAKADAALTSFGLRLYVLDAYRPLVTQWGLWNFFYDRFRVDDTSLTPTQLETKTLRFVSDPRTFNSVDYRTWPLHSTGGSVDVTMLTANGEAVDFGTPFDDATDIAETGYFERKLIAGQLAGDDLRLLGRRILYWSLVDAGFTNYAGEWWHFDYGNQMHVYSLELVGSPIDSGKAWYGYIEYPVPAENAFVD